MHYFNQFPFLSVIKVKYNAQHYLNTSSCTSLLFRIWRLATPKASPRLPIFFSKKNVSPSVTVPTIMISFHNTLYQYHIHIRSDMHAVYALSPGRNLKIEGIPLISKVTD